MATKYDVAACVRLIRNYNYNDPHNDEFELWKSILKNLGYQTSRKNIDIVSDHLTASSDEMDKLPEDPDVIYELIDLLEGTREFNAGGKHRPAQYESKISILRKIIREEIRNIKRKK